MKKRNLQLFCFLLTLTSSFCYNLATTRAATINVSIFTDTVNDDGSCSLREAISSANSDSISGIANGECTAGSGTDTLQLPIGIYTLSIAGTDDGNSSGDFDITSDMTITGLGATADDVIIDANDIDRIFDIRDNAVVTIDTLTVTDGTTNVDGGGISVGNAANLTLNSVKINFNVGDHGGGIYVDALGPQSGVLTINDSTMSDNTAQDGGALNSKGTSTLNNVSISNNSAVRGGGIYSENSITITDSDISGNTATQDAGGHYAGASDPMATSQTISNTTYDSNTAGSYGGGIRHSGGTLTISSTTISNNNANTSSNGGVTGGGLTNNSGNLTMYNSTISGNDITDGDGGGLGITSGTIMLKNNTIVSNSADQGGGIYASALANFTIQNNIIANNTAVMLNGPDLFADVDTTGFNIVEDTDSAFNLDGSDITGVDPALGSLYLNAPGSTKTHELLVGSPAIDAGDDTICGDASTVNNLDQRGATRPSGVQCDIGAFEYSAVTSVDIPTTITDSQTVVTQGQSLTYTITITNSSGSTVNNIIVNDTFPSSLTSPSWTCAISSGVGSCGTAGPTSGNISAATISLNSAAVATFTVSATVGTNVISNIANRVTITMPSGFSNSNVGNGIATDTDQVKPKLAEVTPVTTPSSNTDPTYTFTSSEAGTITYGGSCSSATTSAVPGSNTITFNTLAVGTYSNCTIIVTDIDTYASASLSVTAFTIIPADIVAPTLTASTLVPTPGNDSSPNYTFSSDEAGTITYGGSCSSGTTAAILGLNTITFNTLANGTYNNCTIMVTDSANNDSTSLAVNTFVIDTVAPTVTEVTPVAPQTNNLTPTTYTFSTSEAGTITYGGACTSSTASASSGSNTITFNTLSLGTYSNCTITVTDTATNTSTTLAITAFQIVASSGGGGGSGGSNNSNHQSGSPSSSSDSSNKNTDTTTANHYQKILKLYEETTFSYIQNLAPKVTDGFKSNDYLRREETVTFLLDAFDLADDQEDYCQGIQYFADLSVNDPAANIVCQAYNLEISKGYNSPNNLPTFQAKNILNRAEFLALLVRTLEKTVPAETLQAIEDMPDKNTFIDVNDEIWYSQYADFAEKNNLFKGPYLRPFAPVQWKEAARIMYHLSKKGLAPSL